jgi:7-carboxy-7-deazaguanine synthase (Cx14CxxC type)
MTYSVKEIFYTLQGEGANAGRPAVFCRFSGCNLWSGREADRNSAMCRFCDTDFVGVDGANGGKFTDAASLADAIERQWPVDHHRRRFVVLTGGEPLLQVDTELVDALRARGFFIAVETNGTVAAPTSIDWVCVSPKAGTDLVIRGGQELKLVFPQVGAEPGRFSGLDFDHFFLQPMDGPLQRENTAKAVAYCQAEPLWNLSVQTHKMIGIR